jgi:phage gp36-like protein
VSSYATPSDLFTHGAPSQSFQVGGVAISNLTLQAELDAVSAEADGYIGPRGMLPLLTPYPPDLVRNVCTIAAYNILSVRGLNPIGPDSNLRLRYVDAMKWLEKIRTQGVSPLFLFSSDTSRTHTMPFVSSSSVVNLASGRRAPNRRW